MKILFAVAEAAPFVKTGGLADVAGSLPAALRRLGVDVRVILPKYRVIPESWLTNFQGLASFPVPVAWRQQTCGLETVDVQGVPYYFLDNAYYFNRPTVYDEFDTAEQFTFFTRAVLESLPYIPEFWPDIIHCHDWHTALIPLLLQAFYRRDPRYAAIKTVLTIHNLKYQGVFPYEVLGDIIGLGDGYFTAETLEFYGSVNYLKAGLRYADRVTTVSPTYAQEILTPAGGEQLDSVLRQRPDPVIGIVNGWESVNESQSPDFLRSVPLTSFPEAKAQKKEELQRCCGLPVRKEVPVLGMVTRLVDQKGLDLLVPIIHELLALDVQLVVLGSGEPKYEEMMRHLAEQYPQQVAAYLFFSEEWAHRIYAGADIFLMPSRFEPCGIAQMIAMRHGTIPLVRKTGGLADTVRSFEEDPERGNGFRFEPYQAQELLFLVQRVVRLFHKDPPAWNRLRKNALKSNFSWERSASAYRDLYHQMR